MMLKAMYPLNPMMDRRLLRIGYDGSRILNLGAGINPIEGATNHDLYPKAGIQLTFSVTDIPWPISDGEYEKVLAFHLIEHIPIENLNSFFQEVKRVLVPGGVFIAETPDIGMLCKEYLSGNMNALRFIYSRATPPGDAHVWGHTAESLATLAYANGFAFALTKPGTDYHADQMGTVRLEAVRGA